MPSVDEISFDVATAEPELNGTHTKEESPRESVIVHPDSMCS
jgi:hypothetical protein